MIRWITILLLFAGFGVSGQPDPNWWNDLHMWDGVTPWQRYIVTSPGLMGPNALPVPEFQTGRLPTTAEFEFSLDRHFGNGDQTTNIFTSLYTPLFSDRVGLRIWAVPFEFYELTPETRDQRRARNFDAKGSANGDIYFGTAIQVVKDKPKWPDILATINLRTASGTDLEDARFTDTPGYYFDISAGKTITLNPAREHTLRPYALFGFYVWQTHETPFLQNDAVQFAAGIDFESSKWKISNAVGGYAGYIGNGDTPVVYRMNLFFTPRKKLSYRLQFQHGLNDFDYTSLRLGAVLKWGEELGREG